MKHDPGGKIKYNIPDTVISKALFSKDGTQRFYLIRKWGPGPTLVWILMNPSTATSKIDDPTLKKCRKLCELWGYKRMIVLNVVAYRLTDSKKLKYIEYSNNRNLYWIEKILARQNKDFKLILGWGNLPKNMQPYANQVTKHVAIYKPYCLGVNKNGSPKHPLYIAESTKPAHYSRF